MRISAIALGAIALILATSAQAQQFSDTESHLPLNYGTYQCGPIQIALDGSWKPTAQVWDGTHYWVGKAVSADAKKYGVFDYVFAFPLPREPQYEYAYEHSPHFLLDLFRIGWGGSIVPDKEFKCSKS